MTTTTVTTVARRITRVVNSRPREVTLCFDRTTGHQIDSWSTGLRHVDRYDPGVSYVTFTGQKNAPSRATERQVQVWLDAVDEADGDQTLAAPLDGLLELDQGREA